MKYLLPVFCGALMLIVSCEKSVDKAKTFGQSDKGIKAEEISFNTSDNIKIIGDLYELNKKDPTILLFHQGGSNARAEYGSIIPILLKKGFNILAIDQRMGGQAYGNYNRTLADIPTNSFGDGYTYCDAFNNLEGALEFITTRGFTGNKILWGSSYSASLAIQLAHQRPEQVKGVLAFSPASGGSMKACLPNQYFETLKVPLLMLRPPGEMESESSQQQFELAKKYDHQTYVPKYGVHGSSMLVKDRVGQDVDETWENVLAFLDELKG